MLNNIKKIFSRHFRLFRSSQDKPAAGKHSDIKYQPVSRYMGSKKGILFFPDWSYYNPYQKMLYGNLNKLYDCSIFGFRPEDFSIDCIKPHIAQSRILHLHWINVLYQLQDPKSIRQFIETLNWAKSKGLTIIWTVHNFISHESGDKQLELEIRKQVAKIANYLIVHGKLAKDVVCKSYRVAPEKTHIIPHGHYKGFYKDELSIGAARKKLGVPDMDYVFLFFGNIRAYKGLENLVEAFIKVHSKHPQTSLLIAGRGLDPEIRQFVETKMAACKKITAHMVFIDDDDVQVYMNASDIVVLPYKDVLTSGAALLALSFKKPVLAPSKGLIPEVVDASTGTLFTGYDQMASMMEACISGTIGERWTETAFQEKLDSLEWKHLIESSIFNILLKS